MCADYFIERLIDRGFGAGTYPGGVWGIAVPAFEVTMTTSGKPTDKKSADDMPDNMLDKQGPPSYPSPACGWVRIKPSHGPLRGNPRGTSMFVDTLCYKYISENMTP
jgi:hypothetical protein